MSKINVYDKIMFETRKKEKIWKLNNCLHKHLSKKWFRAGIHSLLR